MDISVLFKYLMRLIPYTHLTPKGKYYGLWACKRAYSKYPQAYPEDFLKRVYDLFEVDENTKVCHLFSGSIDEPYTVDLNPNSKARFRCDATKTPFPDNFFDLVLADPPYNKERAKVWGYKLPTIKSIIFEMRRITKVGGYYCLLHFIVPRDWFKECVGVIAVTEGANMRIRAFTIFQKQNKSVK